MVEYMARRLIQWWQRRVTIYRLEALDDRLLADLGTSREQIARFVDELETC